MVFARPGAEVVEVEAGVPHPRILLVDDEPQVLKSLHRLLRSRFEVETAAGGHEALAKLELFRPDVVISDFRMPVMNGAELLLEVKRRYPLTLRLILSGYADLEAVPGLVGQAGISRYLHKPWNGPAMMALLDMLLASRVVPEASPPAQGGDPPASP